MVGVFLCYSLMRSSMLPFYVLLIVIADVLVVQFADYCLSHIIVPILLSESSMLPGDVGGALQQGAIFF